MNTGRLRWAGLAAAVVLWAGSWRIIYLEVTRWHHMDSHLRFTPPPVPPGSPAPSAGLPVITALVVAGAAPVVTVVAAALLVRRSRLRRR
ncbi:hypothetical protein ACGFMK_27780 [Amycolatopsis sp. NPDC049252]|uniref:hypothetical protein n=1 Tax=Amycolatopsis sp. NPDC049252 TaxID=3363933 RepID=UPI0037156E99